MAPLIYVDSWNGVPPQIISTGRSSLDSIEHSGSLHSRRSSGQFTPSFPDLPTPMPTYTRRIRPSVVHDSIWEPNYLNETQQWIGRRLENSPSPDYSPSAPQIYTYDAITTSNASPSTTLSQHQLNESFSAFGETQEQESLDERGTRQRWMPFPRFPQLNSGMAIRDRRTLSSTNSAERWDSHTSYDGSIATRWWSRLKGPQCVSRRTESGSLQTSIQETGTQMQSPLRCWPY